MALSYRSESRRDLPDQTCATERAAEQHILSECSLPLEVQRMSTPPARYAKQKIFFLVRFPAREPRPSIVKTSPSLGVIVPTTNCHVNHSAKK